MIDREQVLHVARLARLELSDEEVTKISGELSNILEHIEKIGELDLDGVPPTSHVVEVPNALRPDEPRPVPAARGRARAGARRRRRRLPRAQPDRMSRREIIALTAAQAAGAVERGELDRRELFEAYRDRAAADELNAYLWVADEAPARQRRAARTASRSPSRTSSAPRACPSQAGSRILEGYRPPYTATVVRRLAEAGAPLLGKTNQDEFAMGSSNENSAYGPALNPWDRTRVPGGSSGGSAAAVAAGSAPWALGTDTGGSIRQPAALCGIVGLKPTYGAVSRFGMIAFASSLDQAGPLTRDVTDAALLFRHMVGHDDRDATSVAFPEEVRLPDGAAPGRDPPRRARRPHRRGRRAGRAWSASRPRWPSRASLGATRRARRAAARRLRPERLLRARAGRGVVEPRALRRRALRPAPRRPTTC